MATIEITEGERIAIHSEYRERDLCKQVPGSRWDKDQKIWTVPLSWGSCIALRGVFGSDLTIGEQLAAWSWAEYESRVQPAEAVRTSLEAPDLMAEEPKLYPFQRSGVRFLETAKRALIADEMGTGKTIQILRALERQGARRTLVVCPNSTKYNWAKETERWTSMTPIVVDGTAAKRRKQIAEAADVEAAVVIINWESLRLHTRSEGYGNMALSDTEKAPKELNEIEWDAIVADEAHRAKNPKAKQTRALWAVSRDAEIRIAATGTPIANHPGDLWSIMNFVAPEDFPTKTKYIDRYCATSFNPFGGMDITGVKASTAEEFAHIVDSRMIRRVKDVVLTQLPSKVYSTRELTMSAKQAKAYRQMADSMLAELEDGELVTATNPLSQMTRLSQFSCAYAEMDDEGNVTLSDPSNKIDAMMDIVDEAEGQPIVVFAESRQLIRIAQERLEKANVPYGIVAGDITPAQRQEHIDAFQAGKLPVMLVTVGAGGEGITLTAARVGVFLQRSWSMVKNKQAEDRIHRPGAEVHDSIEIIDLVTKGTIEEYRATKLLEKGGRLQEVVRDETLREMLSYR